MNIRQKILVYFSVFSTSLVGLAFFLIYTLFSNYRSEEFQQRIKDKAITTVKFMVEIQQIDHNLLRTMDEYTLNNLYKEKILIFDKDKTIIYTSLDDTKIEFPNTILDKLNAKQKSIEFEEEGYDVVGIYFEIANQKYYSIAKAYDKFGWTKLEYLKYVLIIIFCVISSIVLIISFLLSKQISKPINDMASELRKINLDSKNSFIKVPKRKDEIFLLATRFNELMKRLNDSFSFQKHAIHHISHELKTPIAILVSNFEKMEKETDLSKLQQGLLNQKEDTKNLSDIINALLEISKVETGNNVALEKLRIDELIFDVVEEIKILNKSFQFDVDIDEKIESEQSLTLSGNKKLLRLALVNLVANCIQYSNNKKAYIKIYNQDNKLMLEFINNGQVIVESEKQFIFQHFFRGGNSQGKRGFGLGLVLIYKIITIHNGTVEYENSGNNKNIFKIALPLS